MREKLQTLSSVVLREFAKDKKIKGITAMRKAELIDAIIEASGGEEAQAEAPETHIICSMTGLTLVLTGVWSGDLSGA